MHKKKTIVQSTSMNYWITGNKVNGTEPGGIFFYTSGLGLLQVRMCVTAYIYYIFYVS